MRFLIRNINVSFILSLFFQLVKIFLRLVRYFLPPPNVLYALIHCIIYQSSSLTHSIYNGYNYMNPRILESETKKKQQQQSIIVLQKCIF